MSQLSCDTFAYLRELAAGRDKAWFETHRARYEAHLLEPMRALVGIVGARLREGIPDLECRPQVNKCLTRINRDMRFARGQAPYKDHMLALFYRVGRKKQDPQLFVGVQPGEVWAGLYLAPPFLAADAPMGQAVADRPDEVVALGQACGVGADLFLGACTRYGEVARRLDGGVADHYLAGPHLCAMRVFEPEEVASDRERFGDRAAALLWQLVPLWRAYSEGL